MDKDIQAKVRAAIQAGANPQEAMARGMAKQQQRTPQSISQGNFSSPDLVQGGGFVGNIVNSLARPAVKTGQMIAGTGFEGARAALSALGSKGLYDTDRNTGRHAIQNPFLSQDTLESTNTTGGKAKIVGGQALQSAALASYGIPVGGATKFAGKVIAPGAFKGGALVGGLQSASEEGANAGSIATGALTGGVLGKGLDMLGKGASKLQNKGKALEEFGSKSRVGEIRIKPSVGGAQREKAIQSTLGRYGIKGTPQAKYEMLEPTMERISKAVESYLDLNPKKVSVNTLEELFKRKVTPFVRQGDITLDEALQGFKEYITEVKKVTPDALNTSKGIFELKKDLQAGMSTLYNKTGSLTPAQKSMKAIRDTFDEVISSLHPDVKKLTLDQSRLFDSAKPLSAQRATVPTLRIASTTMPKGMFNAGVDSIGRGIENTGKAMQKTPNLTLNGMTKSLVARTGASMTTPRQSQLPQPSSAPSIIPEVPAEKAPQLTPEFMSMVEMSGASESTKNRFRKAYEYQKTATGGGGKLTEKQNAYKSAADGAQYALNLLESGAASTGPGTRTSAGVRRTLGLSSSQQQDFEGTLSLARGYLLNALSGANVPPSEYQRLASLLEIEGSNPEVAKQQLKTFIRESQRFLGQQVSSSITLQ